MGLARIGTVPFDLSQAAVGMEEPTAAVLGTARGRRRDS
jgi:hypothetical protein